MWNKTYRLNALGLADQIVNGGAPQLAGPMRLVAVVDGHGVGVATTILPSLTKPYSPAATWAVTPCDCTVTSPRSAITSTSPLSPTHTA
jgi:hypothetical protein